MIFPLWQTIGQSSHLLAKNCGEVLGEPATHTGTLDPMASGVIVILTGDDRYAKGTLRDWKKTYEFSNLWGVATDSFDKLGLITKIDTAKNISTEQIQEAITHFPSSYAQPIPAFSSRRIAGQSAFDFAKAGKQITAKKKICHIDFLKLVDHCMLSIPEILKIQEDQLQQVTGDFRQDQIKEEWRKQLSQEQDKLLLTTHTATVSTGTYIRQLVQDLAKEVGIPATTWSITRTINGPYAREDCIESCELASIAPKVS